MPNASVCRIDAIGDVSIRLLMSKRSEHGPLSAIDPCRLEFVAVCMVAHFVFRCQRPSLCGLRRHLRHRGSWLAVGGRRFPATNRCHWRCDLPSQHGRDHACPTLKTSNRSAAGVREFDTIRYARRSHDVVVLKTHTLEIRNGDYVAIVGLSCSGTPNQLSKDQQWPSLHL